MQIARTSAVALVVAGAFFMENLDATVIVTALPEMARSFAVAPVDLSVGISCYVLTLAVLIPVSGWIADRFGARRVFALAILTFTLASILCGVSRDLMTFTAARVLQGVGGAMMVPVGRLVVLRATAKADLMRAIATITWPGLAAPVLGPPLGGFITTYASWRWIFFLNVPLGLVALVMALRLLPATAIDRERPFDLEGFLLTGLACFGIMYGVELLSRGGNGSWFAPAAVLASLALAWGAVRHARRRPHPLLDLWALGLSSYRVTLGGGTLFRIAIGAIPFLLPLLYQLGYGLDPFRSGLLLLAVFAGNLAMKPLTTPVLRRFRFKSVLIVNGLLIALTTYGCAFVSPQASLPGTAILLFMSGLCRSMQFTALNTLAFAEVPQARMSGANTLFNMAQQIGMGMGIAIGALSLRLADLVTGAPTQTSLLDFRLAFLLIGTLPLLAVLDMLRLEATAGDALRVGPVPAPAPVGEVGRRSRNARLPWRRPPGG